jgi:hypothetical protein
VAVSKDGQQYRFVSGTREDAMAQEAFETDFWKDANLRKMWDDIVPGEPRKTIPYTLIASRSARTIRCISMKATRKPRAIAG